MVLYSLLPLLVIAALLEGGARVYDFLRPAETGVIDLSFGFDPSLRLFLPIRDGAPGRLQRFRRETGTPEERSFLIEKPAGTFRIFAPGGSSVAFLQEHFDALEARLNARYAGDPRIELINAGMWSYGSQRVMIIAREVMEYDPDLLLLYSGHNEFEDLRQLELVEKGVSSLQRLLICSALYRIYWHHSRQRQLDILQSERNMALLQKQPFTDHDEWLRTISHDDLYTRMRAFQRNIKAIVELCRDRHVALILGTVPSNYWEPAPEEGWHTIATELTPLRNAGKYEDYMAAMGEFLTTHLRRQSSPAENTVIRQIADKYKLPLADVFQAVCEAEPHGVPGEALFDDSCHLFFFNDTATTEIYTPLIIAEIERAR
mgnify:CR=1 FL=1